MNNSIELQSFYPTELYITDIQQDKENIFIMMRSKSTTRICPKCGKELSNRHGTYQREVQDLPILGKHTVLKIRAHEYQCDNDECAVKTVAESYDGFLSRYSRMTFRCEDFISNLALETSCEGAARICKASGIQICGQTIIRMLKDKFEHQEIAEVPEVIGVDDFASKKRFKYCTVVCNGITHEPIAILEGRDGSTFKEWLSKNKNIKVVTRDRACAYASAITEVLPDAMQIADRFHLHQNLLEAVQKVLSRELPMSVAIKKEDTETSEEEKTNECNIEYNKTDNQIKCIHKNKMPCKKNRISCG